MDIRSLDTQKLKDQIKKEAILLKPDVINPTFFRLTPTFTFRDTVRMTALWYKAHEGSSNIADQLITKSMNIQMQLRKEKYMGSKSIFI